MSDVPTVLAPTTGIAAPVPCWVYATCACGGGPVVKLLKDGPIEFGHVCTLLSLIGPADD